MQTMRGGFPNDCKSVVLRLNVVFLTLEALRGGGQLTPPPPSIFAT